MTKIQNWDEKFDNFRNASKEKKENEKERRVFMYRTIFSPTILLLFKNMKNVHRIRATEHCIHWITARFSYLNLSAIRAIRAIRIDPEKWTPTTLSTFYVFSLSHHKTVNQMLNELQERFPEWEYDPAKSNYYKCGILNADRRENYVNVGTKTCSDIRTKARW